MRRGSAAATVCAFAALYSGSDTDLRTPCAAAIAASSPAMPRRACRRAADCSIARCVKSAGWRLATERSSAAMPPFSATWAAVGSDPATAGAAPAMRVAAAAASCPAAAFSARPAICWRPPSYSGSTMAFAVRPMAGTADVTALTTLGATTPPMTPAAAPVAARPNRSPAVPYSSAPGSAPAAPRRRRFPPTPAAPPTGIAMLGNASPIAVA